MMNDTVMANPSQPQAFMSSSNLVDITQKRVLVQVSGESSYWFNQLLIDQLKGVLSLCLLSISSKLRQVEGVRDVSNTKESKILIGQKMSALTLATHPCLDITYNSDMLFAVLF